MHTRSSGRAASSCASKQTACASKRPAAKPAAKTTQAAASVAANQKDKENAGNGNPDPNEFAMLKPTARLEHYKLSGPTHLAVVAEGELVVSSTLNHMLHVFSLESGDHRRMLRQADLFTLPTGVACDPAEPHVLWSASCEGCVVRKVALADGVPVQAFGSEGGGDGHLRGPEGLAIADGKLFIADQSNHRIVKVDTARLEVDFSFGGHGTGAGSLCHPRGLAANDGDAEVFVADTENHRICVFRSATGAFVRLFGGSGRAPGSLLEPDAIVVHDLRLVVVAESLGRRVQVLTRRGAPIQVLETGWNGTPFGQLAGLAVSGSTLFLSDFDQDCIHCLDCLSVQQARDALDASLEVASLRLRELRVSG